MAMEAARVRLTYSCTSVAADSAEVAQFRQHAVSNVATAAHVKGFALRLEAPLPVSLVARAASCRFIAWDGDDFASTSFVRAIHAACAQSHVDALSVPALLAFKWSDDEARFVQSWHRRRVLVERRAGTPEWSCIDLDGVEAANEPFDVDVSVPIHYVLHDASARGNDQYVELGAWGLRLTCAGTVLAWGGGPLVLREFHASQAALRVFPASRIDVAPPAWHIWRAERKAASVSAPATHSAALAANCEEADVAVPHSLMEQSALNDILGMLRVCYE